MPRPHLRVRAHARGASPAPRFLVFVALGWAIAALAAAAPEKAAADDAPLLSAHPQFVVAPSATHAPPTSSGRGSPAHREEAPDPAPAAPGLAAPDAERPHPPPSLFRRFSYRTTGPPPPNG